MRVTIPARRLAGGEHVGDDDPHRVNPLTERCMGSVSSVRVSEAGLEDREAVWI
jgi:hypothetical protein